MLQGNQLLGKKGVSNITEDEKLITYNKYLKSVFSKLTKLSLSDIRDKKESVFFSKYTKESVVKWLQDPNKNQKQLRQLVNYLYVVSSHFKRLIDYFSKMCLFYYVIIPYGMSDKKINKKMYKSAYNKTAEVLNNMNIPHEFKKIMTIVFTQDIFYGYCYSSESSFYIRQLPEDYCRISSIEDGTFLYEFDLSYFSTREDIVDSYGEEFRTKYNLYKANNGNKNFRWQEIDGENSICIKFNEEIPYCCPPFSGVLEALFAIQDYKALFLAMTEIQNIKLLSFKIPLDENGNMSMDDNLRQKFYSEIESELPARVGLVISPFEISEHTFEKTNVGIDFVSSAENSFFSEAGVSQMLFNNEKATSAIIQDSISADFDVVNGVVRQLERWVNKRIKNLNSNYKFKINILPVSSYNQQKMFDMYYKASNSGLPTKMYLTAVAGLSPSDTFNMGEIEDIFDIRDSIFNKPLYSSSTLSSDEGGRPKTDDGEITESGEQTRDDETNSNRPSV